MGINLDDLLSYKTFKTVTVRSRWLGLIYYGTILAIVLWTGIGVVYAQEGYVRAISTGATGKSSISLVPIAGAVRASVIPKKGPLPAVSTLDYCDPTIVTGEYSPKLPCVYPDFSSLSKTTPGGDGALFISTRMSQTIQQRNESCGFPSEYPCQAWSEDIKPKESFYVGALEESTVKIWHAVSKSLQREYAYWDSNFYIMDSFALWRPPATMYGDMKWSKHKGYSPGSVITVTNSGDGDVISVKDLLMAAGLDDIDDPMPDPSAPGSNTSTRYDGQTIRIRIVYTGHRMNALNPNASYAYYVSTNSLAAKVGPYVDDAAETPLAPGNRTRSQVELRGLQILFEQEGELLIFDGHTLYISLMAGVALLAVAKSVADFVMLYVSPTSKNYKLFVNTPTPDFVPDNEAERHALDQMLRKKRRKHALVLANTNPMTEPLDAGSIETGPPVAAAEVTPTVM